jgi:uncharacterized protein (DUF2267 family)
MRLGSWLDIVEEVAGISREEAERATRATLCTLAERITRGEAEDIAAFLPKELRGLLTWAREPAEAFNLGEFLRRIAERAGVDERRAYEYARAVFAALGVAVAPGEVRDMASQLPKEYEPLLEAAGTPRRHDSAEEPLLARVAGLASVDLDTARRAVEAVLETLAVRISGGEAEDLMSELPASFMPAIERGLAESKNAKRMSLDEFLDRVAKLENVDVDEAKRHAKAVFAVLQELLPEKEFHDVTSELPAEYAPLLANVL